MKFLGDFTRVSDTDWIAGYMHFMPTDAIHGITNKDGVVLTEAQLAEKGLLVEDIPDPVIPVGQQMTALHVNPVTKAIWYDYAVIPPTPEQEIAQLKTQLAQAQTDNLTSLIAIAEIYEMIIGGM